LAVSAATLVHSQDSSDAQQKALEALRQYTAEKEGKSSKPLTTKPVQKSNDAAATKELEQKAREAAKPKQAQPAVAAPVAAPVVTKTVTTPAAASPVAETEQERKAREALDTLRRTAAEPKAQAMTSTPPAEQHDNAEAAARAALEASYAAVPTGNTISPDLENKARTSLDALAVQKPTPTASNVAAPSTPVPSAQVAVVSKPKPQTHKEKLNRLLELYMGNAITARQYHDQRAALIASN